jgi:serine/threonine-protein kinase
MPFEANTIMHLAKKHVQSEATRPDLLCPDLSKEISDVILKALSKKPEKRQQSAMELAQELRAATGMLEAEEALTKQLKRLNPTTSTLTATLIIQTIPSNCNIYLNNHYTGTTNDHGTITLQDIPSGKYKALIARIGYKDKEIDVAVNDTTMAVNIELMKIGDEPQVE